MSELLLVKGPGYTTWIQPNFGRTDTSHTNVHCLWGSGPTNVCLPHVVWHNQRSTHPTSGASHDHDTESLACQSFSTHFVQCNMSYDVFLCSHDWQPLVPPSRRPLDLHMALTTTHDDRSGWNVWYCRVTLPTTTRIHSTMVVQSDMWLSYHINNKKKKNNHEV